MAQPTYGADVRGQGVVAAARELGWTVREPEGGATDVIASLDGTPQQVVSALARLVAAAVEADWWLARLEISALAPSSSSVVATFTGGRRVATARATAASARKRRSEGEALGRKVAIPPEVLERIVQADASGTPYQEIARQLAADGVPTPGGAKRWYASTVRGAVLRSRRGT